MSVSCTQLYILGLVEATRGGHGRKIDDALSLKVVVELCASYATYCQDPNPSALRS